MENFTRIGYGYVEPNFLSAPRTGQVRADLPVSQDALKAIAQSEDGALMNGMFVQRHGDFELAKQGDTEKNCVDFGTLEDTKVWWLVFNEEKLYDERKQMHRDFAMTAVVDPATGEARADQFYDGWMVPRVLLPLIGDTFTTNCFTQEVGEQLEPGTKVAPAVGTGMLEVNDEGFLQVVRCYTMPDGQPGVKLAVVANQ